MQQTDVFMLVGAIVVAIALVVVVRARVRSHTASNQELAEQVVCEHLRPVWELLASREHRATRVGQRHPELPIEIHVQPGFDPQAVYQELQLDEPVFVSDRNVLYCKEDWCEIHPTA